MDGGYCLRPGYHSRLKPEYFDDTSIASRGVVWQPEVYPFAAHLGRRLGCTHIIDLGCGSAHKVVKLYPEFQIVGVDFGPNIQYCRSQFPYGRWIEYDLDKPGLPPIEPQILRHAVIICSDVIEHVVHPEFLLGIMRSWLDDAPVALLSTPDRDIAQGTDDMGPPANPSHVREWNRTELARLLQTSRLRLEFIGLTTSNDRERIKGTTLAVIGNSSLSEKHHAPPNFRVAAVVMAENEEQFMAATLRRLIAQGIEPYVADTGSVDRAVEIARSITGAHVLTVSSARDDATEPSKRQAPMIDDISRLINADWLIVQRGHEAIEPPWLDLGLKDALYYVDQCGFSRIECSVYSTYPSSSAAEDADGAADLTDDFAWYDPMLSDEAEPLSGASKREQVESPPPREKETAAVKWAHTYPYQFLLKRGALHSGMDAACQNRPGGTRAIVIPSGLMPFDADFYQRFLVERLSGQGLRPTVSVGVLEAMHIRIERQDAQIAELRRWGADQAALIEEQHATIQRQDEALAAMRSMEVELRSMEAELRTWGADQAERIRELEAERTQGRWG